METKNILYGAYHGSGAACLLTEDESSGYGYGETPIDPVNVDGRIVSLGEEWTDVTGGVFGVDYPDDPWSYCQGGWGHHSKIGRHEVYKVFRGWHDQYVVVVYA